MQTTTTCPSCLKEIPADAKFCPHCGKSLTAPIIRTEKEILRQATTPKQKQSNTKGVIGAILVIFIIIVIKVCNDNTGGTTGNNSGLSDTTVMPSVDTSKPLIGVPQTIENWEYSEEENKMDNTKMYFASTTSVNSLYFKFPYDGGSTGKLFVRRKGKNDVYLYISKGQFLSSIGDDNYMRIKYDDHAPETISYNGTSDGSTNYVFLDDASSIIRKLKKAKKVIIEVEFYQEGKQQLNFDVEGLKWEH